MKNENIGHALNAYNNTSTAQKFSILDALILDTIASGAYKTDRNLALTFMCSERTIKRSINKLCEFGFIKKHLAHDNTKTLELHATVFHNFLKQYCPKGD